MKDVFSRLKQVKTIGLLNTPNDIDESGTLNTNQMIFLLKKCILKLEEQVSELRLEIAYLKDEVESD